MTVLIQRQVINGETWFELLGHKQGDRILVDIDSLKMIQDSGIQIKDLDAIRLDCARNN